MKTVANILTRKELSKHDVVRLLSISNPDDQHRLIKKAYFVKETIVGKKVYLRGLIEFSNQCRKNCLYCGIRKDNSNVTRYSMSDDEILQLVEYALRNQLTDIVLQSGELDNERFTRRITSLIRAIKKVAGTDFRITLSLGEQSKDTYQEWFDAGAQRYLLRIETSNEALYKKIHPHDEVHQFRVRLKCLETIQKTGYQTGTGVMIGLPCQTIDNLADDLLFIKHMDIDMVGMGPYLEHVDTPLSLYKEALMPLVDRYNLSLRMIAVLRLLMPYINIASTTALQSIFPMGREQGLKAGANVIMPNLTPVDYRKKYLLYENKSCLDEDDDPCLECLRKRIGLIGEELMFNNHGDSRHFTQRRQVTNNIYI